MLDNCLKSIDVDWRHLILVDNSKDGICKKYENRGAMIFYYPENIGVSRSWNLGLQAKAEWTFLVSISAIFPAGFSEVLVELKNANDYVFYTDRALHCGAISQKCVEKVGYFDENFYPAYFEDMDYYRRVRLVLGKKPQLIYSEKKLEKIHKIPAYSIKYGTSLESGLEVNNGALMEYYISKWGGKPTEEKFNKPFGDKSIDYYPINTINQLKEKYNLGE